MTHGQSPTPSLGQNLITGRSPFDVATKYVILGSRKGETAKTASGILMDIIRRSGKTTKVMTDGGRAFMSELLVNACED